MDEPGTVSLRQYFECRFASLDTLLLERDRRYAEGALLRAEALRIKEEGDRRALELAREIQTYKDEQANRLREQINQERGLYATHADLTGAVEKLGATIAPLLAYASSQQGRSGGQTAFFGWIVAAVSLAAAVLAIGSRFMN